MEILYSPLSGPVVPLQNVPDPVFAQGMAGDGLAIDPIDSRVLSPCSAKVKQVHRKRHAVTLVTDQGTEERSQSSGSSTGDGTLPYAESAPIVVEAEHGIHARPAATLADTARRFKSTITISGASGRSADAKSVVALLGLEIERGDAIRITARGLDANEAKEALESAAGNAFSLAENQATTRTAVAC